MSSNKAKILKIWEAAALLTLCLCLCAGTWAQGKQKQLYSSFVRLHVLAASDAPEEQALKLRVRDAVLEYLDTRLTDAADPAEAQRVISAELAGICSAAESAAEGRRVTVTLGEEFYPTREYQGFTLPAGRYKSLRVILDEGRGHNWWCIVFPPVCLSSARQQELAETMADGGLEIVTDREDYQIRFRTVELWGTLTEKLAH